MHLRIRTCHREMRRISRVMRIAPLGAMVVEISVGEDDVHHVREGMMVDFYVHALPGREMPRVAFLFTGHGSQ